MTLQDFYRSRQWEKLIATLKLERVNEDGELLCAHCGKPITRKYDCIAHHITELTPDTVSDPTVALNPDNIALIHFSCHNLIHQRFEGFTQQVFLVYGAPCAGKSTWVKSVAHPDDLIVDIDSLWEAVCTSDKYSKPNRLKANVFGLRDCLLDQIKTRTGKWRNAYIIGGYPLRTDRDRLCNLMGAREVFIDESMQTCMQRAQNEAWMQYIEDWFEDYT